MALWQCERVEQPQQKKAQEEAAASEEIEQTIKENWARCQEGIETWQKKVTISYFTTLDQILKSPFHTIKIPN